MPAILNRFAILASALSLGSVPLLAQPDRIAERFDGLRSVVLRGSIHPYAQTQFDRGRVDPDSKLQYVTLGLKPSAAQQSALDQLLEEQQSKASANYHRWLTPEEFGNRFGLSKTDYATVTAWLASEGLHIETMARSRNWIAFSGGAQQIENAFHAEIHRYEIDGETHFANATALRVPAALEDVVGGVRGLDDFWRTPVPEYLNSSGANQLSPDDWAAIYDVKALYNNGIDGTGQRIVIVGRSDFDQSFVDSFRSTFGLPPAKIEMHLIGPDPGVTNAAGEAALDLEWSGGIARNATIVYVYSNNFDDAAQAAIDQNLAPVMSESFGTCEPLGAIGNRAMAQQANAQGITWLASSGDSGGAGCDPHGFFGTTGNSTLAIAGPAVSIPASYPEVTAVGGTQFNEGSGQYWNSGNNSNGGSVVSYIPEMVWNETGAGGLLASGGGASVYFSKPPWQVAPGVADDGARDVPDIAFSASGNHDPYVVVNAAGQRATAGTSAASPSFAGVVALLNQYLVSKGFQTSPGLGNINPQLYRLARNTTNVFHDITQGNNMVPCAAQSPGCSTGFLGFAAAPGYDQATGLGSIDAYNLATQWTSAVAGTMTQVTANPGSIGFGDTFQATATVTPTASSAVPTGTITFSSGSIILGDVALGSPAGAATATLTVPGSQLRAGAATVVATYSGDGDFTGSTGSTTVNVAPPQSPGSSVAVSISPNPAHEGQLVRVTLTELAGVPTTITAWTINGVDDFPRFAADFGSVTLPPYGDLSDSFASAVPAILPSSRVYVFSGVDPNGRQWTQQSTLVLEGAVTPGIQLSSAPGAVLQNPSADPSCQWSQQLILQEPNGLAIQLTRFVANGVDWTARMQPLFGTTRLAPLGNLQGTVCWPAGSMPQTVTYEIDGADQTGSLVTATVATSFAGPAAAPGTLSVSSKSLTLGDTNPSQGSSTITVNLTGNNPAWSVAVVTSDKRTPWLTVTPASGTGPQMVTVAASGAGLSVGVHYAWLVFQAVNALPQVVEVPVAFAVGASSALSISGLTNAASFQQAYAPGMLLSVFGDQLAPVAQIANTLPLPLNMAGVSASVNGIAAPLYYVSPGLLNIQIPYETGAGPAVLGVDNNGRVASYIFNVAPSAPGIFTGSNLALVPSSSGKPGDILTLFITGEGDVTPPLATGATPFIATPVGALPQARLPLTVTVGGIAAQVAFSGIPPGVAGVTQVNFVVPAALAPGAQPVVVTVGTASSLAANLTVSF